MASKDTADAEPLRCGRCQSEDGPFVPPDWELCEDCAAPPPLTNGTPNPVGPGPGEVAP